MLLTVRDVAQVLHVAENKVERWAAESGLPTMRIAGQYRFNRTELLEWATIRQIALDPEVFHLDENDSGEMTCLADSLERGGIRRVATDESRGVWENIAAGFSLSAGCDRAELVQLLASRGPAAWTPAGRGIAGPHPRYPIVLPVAKPMLQLCFLDQALPPADKQDSPVDTLFVLVSPAVKSHLTLVAMLGGALTDAGFADAVRRKSAPEVLLAEARRFSSSKTLQGGGAAEGNL